MVPNRSRIAFAEEPEGAATASGLVDGGSSTHAPEPLLERGAILAGTYRLEGLIARGGMGAVYLASDLALDREVAIKILLRRHAADPRTAGMFRQEAIALASVRHPNVVKVYTAGEHGALPFFVMEYVRGQTVAGLIRESYRRGRAVGLGRVSAILQQAAQGLAAIHDRGLVHGDVKPSNMLLDSSFHVAISDFGMVGAGMQLGEGIAPACRPGFLYGTPLYVAPELVSGVEIPPDRRHLCDVYSLGASVFEMLTGQGLFAGTIREVLRGHLFTAPPRVSDLRPDLPPEIDDVVGRALEKNPRNRHQRFTELAAEVDWVAQIAA